MRKKYFFLKIHYFIPNVAMSWRYIKITYCNILNPSLTGGHMNFLKYSLNFRSLFECNINLIIRKYNLRIIFDLIEYTIEIKEHIILLKFYVIFYYLYESDVTSVENYIRIGGFWRKLYIHGVVAIYGNFTSLCNVNHTVELNDVEVLKHPMSRLWTVQFYH